MNFFIFLIVYFLIKKGTPRDQRRSDASKGLFDEEIPEGGAAIDNPLKVEINYKDGSTYLVMDENVASYHYICGMDSEIITLFNRIVDIDQGESITVNGVVYTF